MFIFKEIRDLPKKAWKLLLLSYPIRNKNESFKYKNQFFINVKRVVSLVFLLHNYKDIQQVRTKVKLFVFKFPKEVKLHSLQCYYNIEKKRYPKNYLV